MMVPVVRKLAESHTLGTLESAVKAFESERSNVLSVEGKDDGEILSNLLVAAFVRQRMDAGKSLQEGLREYSERVRGMIKPKKV